MSGERKAAALRWRDESKALHWIDRYASGIDDDPQMDRILECVEVATPATPAPSDAEVDAALAAFVNSLGVLVVSTGVPEAMRAALLAAASVRQDRLREAAERLVNAKALDGVRGLVAGWNGEGKQDGPYERHPPRLGAELPRTNCGAIYELDDAMQAVRAALSSEGRANEGRRG